MNAIRRLTGTLLIAAASLLAACGGGGGSAADTAAQAADERVEALSASRPSPRLEVCNAENVSTILAAVPAAEHLS